MKYNPIELAEAVGLQTHQGREALAVAINNVRILDDKQQDYGPYNIAGNPHPQLGVAFRSGDKVQRLMNLFLKEKSGDAGQPKHESIADSWMDLANYGIIGTLLHNNNWLGKGE